MDPIAHTLAGATLAEAGLKKFSRYATPALLIGANLPDIDVVASLWGTDAALYFRRGWTHGVLAFLLLPLILASLLWAWHQWRQHRARQSPAQLSASDGPPLKTPALIALCFLAVWTHPLLDWLNTYGVRLLMPLSEQWFYGDTLFIIDPWFWLMTAAGVTLATSYRKATLAAWILLALLATAFIVAADQVAVSVKVGWLAGVCAIAAVRWRQPHSWPSTAVARAGLVALVLYIGATYGAARIAESRASQLSEVTPIAAQANPIPGQPLSHRTVLVFADSYQVIPAQGDAFRIAKQQPDAVVRAALQSESIRGFVNWMRFPYWEKQETADSWIVTFHDLRYVDPQHPRAGIGTARVEIQKADLESF